ncbi:hypothetical protein [Pontivivens ytuae]|uniref:Uncharacterized protein n=1 Tax=Pontivivens ytuae TaxID=2789856 RepID=A0A7S9LUG4_9RHOB|nr:hypothetical protein [Pontivivens ytuae]QPH55531.1 hypothetical protein I0K15_07295 [Pontivivens ytuae]
MILRALLLLLSGAAAAQPVPGADAPPFEAALELWLDDRDADALPRLSTLAGEGNTAAQLLLGTVEHMGELQTVFTLNRSREERDAVYRSPDGRSWLAEVDQPLADLMRQMDDVGMAPQTVLDLHARGEHRLAREAIRLLARRERFSAVRTVLQDLPELAPVVADVPGVEAAPPDRPPLIDAYCAANCPAAPDNCATLGAEVIGDSGLHILGSPLTALISEDMWRASEKGQQSVPRLAALQDGRVRAPTLCEAAQ